LHTSRVYLRLKGTHACTCLLYPYYCMGTCTCLLYPLPHPMSSTSADAWSTSSCAAPLISHQAQHTHSFSCDLTPCSGPQYVYSYVTVCVCPCRCLSMSRFISARMVCICPRPFLCSIGSRMCMFICTCT
jgi:hypothetical protein